MAKRLQDRAVVVTGGGSGIGRGTCLRAAQEGALVSVADIRIELARSVVQEIVADGGVAIAVVCDVAVEDQVQGLVQATLDEFGSLWGMVANAGTAGRGWVHETTMADWQFVLGVNLTGPFLCAKYSLPHMMADGGSFVATSSIAGSVVGAGGAAASYTVSKHGVLGLVKQIAVDYGQYGIRANAIQPAAVQGTRLAAHAAEDQAKATTPPAQLPRPKAWLPIHRAGKSLEEYGATIAFLLSDDAGYITGASVSVDGGYLAT